MDSVCLFEAADWKEIRDGAFVLRCVYFIDTPPPAKGDYFILYVIT